MSGTVARRSVVLIVDDAVENIAMLGAALRGEYEVQFATNGEQAIEIATAPPGPDIILLDVLMPGMDGITVCRMLKEDERTRFIPIVIMTSLEDADDRVRGIEAGADDFLTKPVDQRQLRARIRTALRAKHNLDEKLRSFERGDVTTVRRGGSAWSQVSASSNAITAPASVPLPVSDVPLGPGVMVGEYRIEARLGSGAFGDVYAAEQPLIGKRVAVKVLHARFAADPVVVARFVAEARAVNRVRQRNIIDIFSFGVIPESQRHYFVMELLEGETLGERLRREGRLPVGVVLSVVRDIAAGLDAAHAAGVTHRDLKPDNVFLAREPDGSSTLKILDFGIAKLSGDDLGPRTQLGVVLGTPRYMSPEQSRGRPADRRSDVYALGVMIHEMLTGMAPFDGPSLDVLLQHASEPPPTMSAMRPDLPAGLDAPVLAMLAKRAQDRPGSAGEAVSALLSRAAELGLVEPDLAAEAVVAHARDHVPESQKVTVVIGPGHRTSAPSDTEDGGVDAAGNGQGTST